MFVMSSQIESIAQAWYKEQNLQVLSSWKVWIATALIGFLIVPFLAFIVSFLEFGTGL